MLLLVKGVDRAKGADEVVEFGRPQAECTSAATTPKRVGTSYNRTCAELMRRGLDIDVLERPDCGGGMRFVAAVMLSSAIRSKLPICPSSLTCS